MGSSSLAMAGNTEQVIRQISEMVSKLAGIQLGAKQFPMVESRLRSRMVRLKIDSLDQYLTYLNNNTQEESLALLSLLTTHHTFFFREFNHFEYLLNRGLPIMIDRARQRGDKKIRIWCAAVSRGQEAYSLAMFMRFHLSAAAPDIDFEIWGTDVDPESVQWAQNGVYKSDDLKQAPAMYVEGNWVKGKGDVAGFSKAKDSIKSKCRFQTCNLLAADGFLAQKSFDLIFCRNVFIYFNTDQIKACTATFLKHLEPTGLLFLGVSETLNNVNLPVETCGPSIYKHQDLNPPKEAKKMAHLKVVEAPVGKRKVLCVDDSPAILALLKKIIGSSDNYEVAGTAKNGLEAMELLKTLKVDVITLDLHMPEMDGLQFLSARTDKSIPIIVVSAINRDDLSIAQKALSLGASDYVEKPSLENIAQAANEIMSKLHTVMALKGAKAVAKAPEDKPQALTQKKKVLIVDDSETIRSLLDKIISSDPDLEVVAKTGSPSQVEDLIKKHRPDLITLDIHMPEMDGVTLLKKIYPKYKIPVVMISSISREEGPQVLQALEAGAIDYIQKPEMAVLSQVAPLIRERLKVASLTQHQNRVLNKKKAKPLASMPASSLVVIGASTGGTEAIRHVLESLPSQIPPILIVQHIPAGFSAAFAKRLNDLFPFEVREAKDGDDVLPNLVLIAPGGTQMGVQSRDNKLVVRVKDDAPVNRHKPSVDYLFRSVAQFSQKNTVGVILTGMGADGAKGLKELRDKGAKTIAQDEASCVVFGMPKEAIAAGGAEDVKSLNDIGPRIIEIFELKLLRKLN